MIDTNKIEQIAEGLLVDTDMYVVSCNCSPSNEVELLIDSDTKVSIDSCIALNRAIEAEFDREVEDFALTVASAGIGTELKLLRQYNRLMGGSIEVLLKSGIKLVATLTAADTEGIEVKYQRSETTTNASGKKKKVMVDVEERFTFEQIKSVKEFLDFH